MKRVLGAVLVVASLLAVTANADWDGRGRRWYRPDDGRFSRGRVIDLGVPSLGDYRGNVTSNVIYVSNMAGIQCDLTHVKLSALRDDVRVERLEVVYRNGGNDVIDLDDSDDYGRNWGDRRNGRGIFLPAYQGTYWLDLDDVSDGYPSGRCIDRIFIYGSGLPNRWNEYRPANIHVEGLLLDRAPPPHWEPAPQPRPRDPYPRDPRGPRYPRDPRGPGCGRDPRYC